MVLNDYGKMLLLLTVIVGSVVLAIGDVLDAGDVRLTFATVLAYIMGNGVNAVRKQPPSPVLVPKPEDV